MNADAGKIFVDAFTFGLHGMQLWADYQADLVALQQQRLAEGTVLTLAEVLAMQAKTQSALADNHAKLTAAAAAQDASEVGS